MPWAPGELALTVAQVTQRHLVSYMRQTPWFRAVNSLNPDGFVNENTQVMVLEDGPCFVKCICRAGVVWFRKECLKHIPPEHTPNEAS